MRRIPLALALVGLIALSGCTGGSKSASPTGSDAQKGVAGQYFYVNLHQPPVGGTITSSTGGIDCGASAVTVNDTVTPPQYAYTYIANSCGVNGQTRLPWFQADGTTLNTVTLTATPASGKAFIGWAGDCSGMVATCTLTAGADRTVVAIFGPPGSGHGLPFPGSAHGPAFRSGTLNCFTCHGNAGQGQSIAPACSTCHAAMNRSATGLRFAVTSVTSTSSNIVVTFTVKDDTGANVDLNGADGKNRPFVPRFGLASFTKNASTGIVGPYLVRTAGTADSGGPGVLTPPAVGAPASATTGELTGTPGSYTYTFPPTVTFDPARSADTHTIWMQGSRQEDLTASTTKTLSVTNDSFNFKPGAIGVPVTTADADRREVVSAAACAGCHDGFRPKGTLTGGVFHGGGRVDGTYCAVCHNPSNTRGDPASADEGRRNGLWTGTAAQFIHVIHASAQMGTPAIELFFGKSAATYPQLIANCTACHAASAAQGAQWKTRPTIEACGSCHIGYPFPHASGACEGCHTAYAIEVSHVPYVPRDRNNSIETPGGNTRTNAAALTGAGQVVPGGSKISAVIQGIATNPTGRPVVTFKLQKSDEVYTWAPGGSYYRTVTSDVVFNAPPASPDASKELMNDFVGTIGVYVVFSLPQDGIATPADFNVSVNSDVKTAWMNLGGTGADVTTLSGPVNGFYSITFPNLVIPGDASNLTGGIGYAYELPGTQPLTQVSVNGSAWSRGTPYETFPTTVTTGTVFGQDCSITPCNLIYGGAIAPIQNVWKATGTPRRSIVDNAKCNGCHALLGVGPTFHAGQRNDAPSCSFCHNPNQNKLGWSSNASTFVHAIHAAGIRTVDYGWAASCPPGSTWSATTAQCEDNVTHAKVKAGFAAVEYPQSSGNCGACHMDGTDSFALNGVPVGNLLWTTVASGTMGATPAPAQSPDVGLGTDYGARFSVTMGASGGPPAITPAAGTTLVSSPIAAVCSSCHDSTGDRTHIGAMGGWLYKARGTGTGGGAFDATLHTERCLDCHGEGKVFDIVLRHR